MIERHTDDKNIPEYWYVVALVEAVNFRRISRQESERAAVEGFRTEYALYEKKLLGYLKAQVHAKEKSKKVESKNLVADMSDDLKISYDSDLLNNNGQEDEILSASNFIGKVTNTEYDTNVIAQLKEDLLSIIKKVALEKSVRPTAAEQNASSSDLPSYLDQITSVLFQNPDVEGKYLNEAEEFALERQERADDFLFPDARKKVHFTMEKGWDENEYLLQNQNDPSENATGANNKEETSSPDAAAKRHYSDKAAHFKIAAETGSKIQPNGVEEIKLGAHIASALGEYKRSVQNRVTSDKTTHRSVKYKDMATAASPVNNGVDSLLYSEQSEASDLVSYSEQSEALDPVLYSEKSEAPDQLSYSEHKSSHLFENSVRESAMATGSRKDHLHPGFHSSISGSPRNLTSSFQLSLSERGTFYVEKGICDTEQRNETQSILNQTETDASSYLQGNNGFTSDAYEKMVNVADGWDTSHIMTNEDTTSGFGDLSPAKIRKMLAHGILLPSFLDNLAETFSIDLQKLKKNIDKVFKMMPLIAILLSVVWCNFSSSS